MDHFPALLAVGFDDESHFFFFRFFLKAVSVVLRPRL
jgi:hypothetical protein